MLLEVPCEIVESIAEHMEPSDVIALRQTCSKLARDSFRLHAQKSFTDCTFMLCNRKSMTTLREVSRNKTLCKSLRTIRFSLETIKPFERFEQMVDVDKHRRSWREVYFQWYSEVQDFVQSGLDLHFLLEVFGNLMKVGNIPEIIAIGAEPSCRNPSCGVFGLDQSQPRGFYILWKAMLESNFPIQKLSMGHRDFGVQFPDYGRWRATNAFANLTTLNLIVCPKTNGEGESAITKGVNCFQKDYIYLTTKFIPSLRKLQRLTFGVDNGQWYHGTCGIAFDFLVCPDVCGRPTPQWPDLTYVELHDMAIHPRKLLEFTRAHGDTLRTLRLNGIKCKEFCLEEPLEDFWDNWHEEFYQWTSTTPATEPPFFLVDLLFEAMGGGGELGFADSYNGSWGPFPTNLLTMTQEEAAAGFDEHLRII